MRKRAPEKAVFHPAVDLDGGAIRAVRDLRACLRHEPQDFSLNGLYPAFSLSRYRPIEALKERSTPRGKRSLALRNGLVLVQFIIAQVLIVGTLVIAGQMKFMSGRDLGFRKEQIVTVPIPAYEEARCETLRSRWMQNPSIREVSFAWSAPMSGSHFRTPLEYEVTGQNVEFPVDIKMCDKRYLDIYQIPLVAGRFFARNTNDESNVQWVVNASVVRRMGLPTPGRLSASRSP